MDGLYEMPRDMMLAADMDLASLVALDGASIDWASSVLVPAEGPFWRGVGFIQALLSSDCLHMKSATVVHVLVHGSANAES